MSRMNRSVLTTAMSIFVLSLLSAQPPLACASDASVPGQVNVSPSVESVADTFAFIRWTTQNPGGTILHYAVVQYGTNPDHLDLTAQSPIRINPAHSEMVFRVRMNKLQPGTTYYYKVSSRQANGISDPATSAVSEFTTRAANSMTAGQ
jgi:phosphodiesterase/alkaline phosphatase D-like protein